jgi:hypothetical protein
VQCIPFSSSTPPLYYPACGPETGIGSNLVCFSKGCDGLNSVSVLSSESCLVTAVLVLASCMYYFGIELNDLVRFAKVEMYVRFFLPRTQQGFLVCCSV